MEFPIKKYIWSFSLFLYKYFRKGELYYHIMMQSASTFQNFFCDWLFYSFFCWYPESVYFFTFFSCYMLICVKFESKTVKFTLSYLLFCCCCCCCCFVYLCFFVSFSLKIGYQNIKAKSKSMVDIKSYSETYIILDLENWLVYIRIVTLY